MVNLLGIAPELRDQILEEVLFLPEREPPESPAASLDRKRRSFCDYSCCSDGHDIWVKRDSFLSTASQTPPILLVSRQLYHEASAILAKKKQHYRLDVMYVKECGLWPTWLSVPRMAHHVESIYVQFRIFDPPSDVNPDWRNPRQFFGCDGGMPMMVWNFFALIKDYMRYGPTAFEGLVAQQSAFTVGKVILDILPPPPGTPDDNLGFPHQRLGENSVLDAFAKGKIPNLWPRLPEDQPHLMVAEKMGFFIANKLGGLLSRYEDYGMSLYEHIGSIEIRVGGEPRRLFNIDEMLRMLPTRPLHAQTAKMTAKRKREKEFDAWRSRTWDRRKAWCR